MSSSLSEIFEDVMLVNPAIMTDFQRLALNLLNVYPELTSVQSTRVAKVFRKKITELVSDVEIELRMVSKNENHEGSGRLIAGIGQEKGDMSAMKM